MVLQKGINMRGRLIVVKSLVDDMTKQISNINSQNRQMNDELCAFDEECEQTETSLGKLDDAIRGEQCRPREVNRRAS